jgi:hypothetical protein
LSGHTLDWNPDFEGEPRIKREVQKALRDKIVMKTIRQFAEQSTYEAEEKGLETEHIVWLETPGSKYMYFVRVWFEAGEEKLFVIVEENELGDVCFMAIEGHTCATYADEGVARVEFDPRFKDPGKLGVSR